MKKYLVILAVIVLSLAMAGQAWAVNAIEAINPEAEPVLIYGKAGTGIGKFAVGSTISSATGTRLVYSGPCWVKSISMYGVTAGDAIMVYNGINGATTGIEFELSISANTSNTPTWTAGAYFDRGIYIHSSVATNLVAVVFDY